MSKIPDPLLRIRDPELQDWIDATNYVINAGHYEFPLTTSVPTYQSNNGEQRIYSAANTVGGIDRRFYIYINGIWVVINFDSAGNVIGAGGGGGFGDHIVDADGSSGVFTEFTPDEDVIRTYSNGTYVIAVDTYGQQVASGYKMVFNGLAGNTYWTYSSASTYMQFYENGSLRMEM